MGTKRFKSALLSALLIASLITPLLLLSPSLVHAALTPHDPIYIDGNDNFTPANGVTSGSGTESDPYIIEGWDINAENANGIWIENTTVYFIIRNCFVHDGGQTYHGIYLDNVAAGKIDNVKSVNNHWGIFLGQTSRVNIMNCTVLRNRECIYLYYSSNNNIENCFISEHSYGIYLVESLRNVITNCATENNSFGIYLWWNSSNNTISNCSFLNSEYDGISFGYHSNNNVVMNCEVSKNKESGVKLYDFSENNIIKECNIENNTYGIYLTNSSNNNRIHRNNIIINDNQAYDDGTNYWDNDYPSGGNYWSDYMGEDTDHDGIGDTPREIWGDNNQDRYPLMEPFDEVPSDRRNWLLIVGIVGVMAIISIIAALYMRRRKTRELSFSS